MKQVFSLALFAGLLGVPLFAFAYVSPGVPTGFVNDFADMFTPSEITGLEAKLAAYAQSSGNELAIVTVPTLAGDPIEDYAEMLFKEWGIGTAREDNGILFLIARDDREMRIEVGYGLEPELTDTESAAIIRNILIPAFQNGAYGGGVAEAVNAVTEALGGEYAFTPAPAKGLDIDWFWLVFFVPLWLASILGRSKSWWAGGVIGGIAGVVLGFVFGFLWTGIAAVVFLTPLGLVFDFAVSRAFARGKETGHFPWWIGGGHHRGGRGGFGSGGFGGFGGGMSGGGGASGRW